MQEAWQGLVDIFYSLSFEAQVFVVTIGLFTLIFHASYTQATANKAPAFLTTVGIFGTFVGIAIGLLDFNTADISRSVPALIDGIKTSVWASAAGIFAALTIKLRDVEGFKRRKKTKKAASVDDLITALYAVEQALKNFAAPVQAAPQQPAVVVQPAASLAKPSAEIVEIQTPAAPEEIYKRTQF